MTPNQIDRDNGMTKKLQYEKKYKNLPLFSEDMRNFAERSYPRATGSPGVLLHWLQLPAKSRLGG